MRPAYIVGGPLARLKAPTPKGRAVNKLLLVAPFSLLVGACTPDIAQTPPPATVIAEFDPSTSVVPTPNDLAISMSTGLVTVPVSPTDSAAQTEFNQDYLGSLRGFPQESTAQVLFSGPLDPATVTATNVIAVDVTMLAQVAVKLAFDPTLNAIDVAPAAGTWQRKHQYAIAAVAGSGHLTGANGTPVVGSPAWGLVTSPQPLVTCPTNAATNAPDYTSPDCRATVDVIPSTKTDPAERLADQGQSAAQLEQIRLAYAPLLDNIEILLGLQGPAQIPILWTFTIVDAGEVTFDPANSVVPFPNDVLRTGPNGTVSLPNPATGQPLTLTDCAAATDPTVTLYCGLNTLDGFSTIAPPISENGFTTGAVTQALIDPTTLTAQTVGLVPVASTAPPETATTPEYAPCLNCLSSAAADGTMQTLPQQLQWDLFAPLDEKTTYLAYVTGDVKDSNDGANVIANPIFALVRSKNPISVDGKSQVNILSDAQAAQLEPLRAALQPAIEGLVANGLPRKNIVLAWAFTTQSEASILDQRYAFPGSAADPLPLAPGALVFADATALYQAAAGTTIPTSAIGKFYAGVFQTPVTVTGPGGTFDAAATVNEAVPFALAVPAAPAPAAGYPITIFGHGLTRDRNDFLAIANSLALAGQATIATDVIFHGERSSCTGSGSFLAAATGIATATDDAACADPTTQKCNEDPLFGRCVARDPTTRVACPGLGIAAGPDPTGTLGCQALHLGACVVTDGVCEGGDFLRDAAGRPVISGWNIFSLTNFFATRDNFRQQVVDLSQLVQLIKATGPTSIQTLSGAAFDPLRVGYVGQSLGGILGALFNAVSPDTKYVALNVPGGDLTQIILQAPSFASQKAALVDGLALQGIMPGTPAFDQFIGTVQWIVDPADPTNAGYRLTHQIAATTTINPGRRAFIQFIQGDETVPNVANLALVAAANRQLPPLPPLGMPPSYGCTGALSCYEFTDAIDGFDPTTAPLANRHGFLLSPPSAQSVTLTQNAQLQVATFLATGVGPQ
jgi:hypothetical protein